MRKKPRRLRDQRYRAMVDRKEANAAMDALINEILEIHGRGLEAYKKARDDLFLYGCGHYKIMDDGEIKHIPTDEVYIGFLESPADSNPSL